MLLRICDSGRNIDMARSISYSFNRFRLWKTVRMWIRIIEAKSGFKIGRKENHLSYSNFGCLANLAPFVVRAMNSKAELAIEENRKHDSRQFRRN